MTAVVLLSHGSPDARSSAAAHELARRATRESGAAVVAAFLQHDQPDLTAQCRQLAEAGHTDVVVVPMLITPAFHARVDVPAAVEDAVTSSGIRVALADPIGTDPLLITALDRQLASGPVVLAAAGTGDPDARNRLDALAAAWAERRSAPVAVGYASQAGPDVTTAIEGLESATGVDAAVASFVLYPGVLPDRIAAAAAGRRVTPPLATTPEVIHLIRERVREARIAVHVSTPHHAPVETTPTHERTPA
jgi:sirohydrochlorin ferrochelatase